MLASSLPPNPSLEQLRKQAKEIRDLVRTGHPKFTELVCRLHPRRDTTQPTAWFAGFTLADAQLVVARSYGFASWSRLREHLDVIARYSRSPQRRPAATTNDPAGVDEFLRLACLTSRPRWRTGIGEDPDDVSRQARAREMLAAHPELASATIHTAAAVGDIGAARSLLASDASAAHREGGPHGWPPLLYAALSRLDSTLPGHSTLEVARLLLAHDADPNAGYLPDGEPPPVTALSGAFRGGRDPVNQPAHQYGNQLSRLLLDAGADPNDAQALDNAGRHPHDDGYLPLLLGHGLGRGSGGPWRARLGHRQPTPAELVQDELRYAAVMNLTDRVRLLLRHGPELGLDLDATAACPAGEHSAHDLAALAGNTEIAELLAAAGARVRPLKPVDELVAACLRAERVTVRLLAADPDLARRAVDAERPNPLHPNPLHLAAYFVRPDAIRLLVEVGFPLNDRRGTPLHMAAFTGRLDIVKLLIELGADPTAEAIDDETPGQFAPPDPTPLGWARYNRQDEAVEYLTRIAHRTDRRSAHE